MQEHVLAHLVIIHIDCSIWTGQCRLTPQDLKLADGSQLPPSELANLGSKKVCDPKDLSPFYQYRREAQVLCERVGLRFYGSFAVPEDAVSHILTQLDTIARKFAETKQQFLMKYHQNIEGWISKHPEYADVLRAAVLPQESVAKRLDFDYTIYRMQPSHDDSLVRQVGGLAQTLFVDVAKEANEMFRQSMANTVTFTRRALRPLKRIQEKLAGLQFLDTRVTPIYDTTSDLLNRIDAGGPFHAALQHETRALVLLLSDPEKVQLLGEGLLDVSSLLASEATETAGITDNVDMGDSDVDTALSTTDITPSSPAPTPSHSFYF